MIDIKNLSLHYTSETSEGCPAQELTALKQLSLCLTPGSCHVITGPSGSGKSSLLRVLLKLVPELYPARVEGSVLFNNQDLEEVPHLDLCRQVAYVQQDSRAQFFTRNVQDELFFALENLAIPMDEMFLRVGDAVGFMKLESLLDRSILKLSSGERQKVALTSALALEPKLLILDEPSANLDPFSVMQLADTIKELKAQGCTLLIAEHRLFYLKDLLDQLYILEDGRLAQSLKPVELNTATLQQHQLRSLDDAVFLPSSHKENTAKGRLVFKAENLIFNSYLPPITLKLQKGVVTALIGSNGIGKTSLARLLCGVDQPKNKQSRQPLARLKKEHGVFFVMQDCDYQLFAPSIREELNLSRPADDEAHLKLLATVGLNFTKADLDRLPAALSGGQKQRLIIALALLSEAELIIFDEPTSGLDYANMRRVAENLRELATKDKAILVITHDQELISYAADEVCQMTETGILPPLPLTQEALPKIQQIMVTSFPTQGGVTH